jgi:hypothetical protein
MHFINKTNNSMAQGRKIDAEAKAKVVLAKLIDPQNKSTRDIAEDT